MSVFVRKIRNIERIRRKEVFDLVDAMIKDISFVPKNTVFIKPNICSDVRANTGIITDPLVVEAIIFSLRQVGAKRFIIGEDVAPGGITEKVFRASGYDNLAKKYSDVELVDLKGVKRKIVKWKYEELSLPEFVFDKNVSYINVPTIKTHMQTTLTVSLKNQKGLL